jgi:hypothetical protein
MRVGHVTRPVLIRTLLAIAVCAVAALYPIHSQAIGGRETDRLYFSDCDGAQLVGEVYTDCDGYTTSWGIVSDFEERHVIRCATGVETVTYWECHTQVAHWGGLCIC